MMHSRSIAETCYNTCGNVKSYMRVSSDCAFVFYLINNCFYKKEYLAKQFSFTYSKGKLEVNEKYQLLLSQDFK